jgi:hypothetical protein
VGALKHQLAKLGSCAERYIDYRKIGAVWNKLQERCAARRLAMKRLISPSLLLSDTCRDEMACLMWDHVNIDDYDSSNCWWHPDDHKRGDPFRLPLTLQEDTTARNYLDMAQLAWLQQDVKKVADWIEQQAATAAA